MTHETVASTNTPPEGKPRTRGLWKPIVLLAVVIALVALAPTLGLDKQVTALRDWIAGLGPWAPLAFILAYIVATVAVLPGTPLTLAAGGLFGSVLGVIYVSIASTIGASLCFLIARYFARDAVTRWLSHSRKFAKLDALTERHGKIIIALTRLVPLFPFNLLNFGFGLTRVRFWTYVFWSWLCMLPGTVLYVVGADAVFKAIRTGRVPWILVAVLVVVIAGLSFIVRDARKKLTTREGEQSKSAREDKIETP